VGAFTVFVLMAGVASAVAAINTVPEPPKPTFCLEGTRLADGTCPSVPEPKPGKPQTLLLIGSDKRSTKSADGAARSGQLSDTIMLAHIDPDRPTTLMSIPRDTQVSVPQKDGSIQTEKINAAFAQGGAPLTRKVVKDLLGITASHVVVIDFAAFQEAVNKLDCLYEDIDRSYFNDNSQGQNYSAINVKSGYQLLCGADTLSWVRFRHTDSDLVRAARQQAFLRAAKGQVAASKLIGDSGDLVKIFQHYTQTDITKRTEVLTLLKLALASSGQPIRSVGFEVSDSPIPGNTNLIVTPTGLAKMKKAFLAAEPVDDKPLPSRPKGTAKKTKTVKRSGLATNLVKVPSEATSPQLTKASFDLAAGKLPVYYPSVRLAFGGYASLDPVRTYAIKAGRFSKRSYPAFRLTYSAGDGKYLGQYYGVQGTTWKDAPILKQTHTAVQRGGRTLNVYKAGARYQLVSWSTPKAVYWVSNSVSLSLTNAQMLDIAGSLTRVAG
jgi:LCP family protein required for cell wall assembly